MHVNVLHIRIFYASEYLYILRNLILAIQLLLLARSQMVASPAELY